MADSGKKLRSCVGICRGKKKAEWEWEGAHFQTGLNELRVVKGEWGGRKATRVRAMKQKAPGRSYTVCPQFNLFVERKGKAHIPSYS